MRRCSKPKGWRGTLLVAVAVGCASAQARPSSVERSASCRKGVALQVLGSGGPIADDDRASSSYLVWIDGRARVLIDAGGGVHQRFGASGAELEDLDVVALSHLHVDHSTGLLPLLKSGYFSRRNRELVLVGPSGSSRFPAIDEFVNRLIGSESGAYPYLSSYLNDSRGWFPLKTRVVDATGRNAAVVWPKTGASRRSSLGTPELTAVGVKHGEVPSLGFLVRVGRKTLAFAGDQSANNLSFQKMAKGADLLVLHHSIAETSDEGLLGLHASPSQLAGMAAAIAPKELVLSHHMRRALQGLDAHLATISREYTGAIHVANDLDCFPVLLARKCTVQ